MNRFSVVAWVGMLGIVAASPVSAQTARTAKPFHRDDVTRIERVVLTVRYRAYPGTTVEPTLDPVSGFACGQPVADYVSCTAGVKRGASVVLKAWIKQQGRTPRQARGTDFHGPCVLQSSGYECWLTPGDATTVTIGN